MLVNRPLQKLVSFSSSSVELNKIDQDIKDGWGIVRLVQNGNTYVAIMEKSENDSKLDGQVDSVYIPARKKIKINRS